MSFNPAKFLFGWLTPPVKARKQDDFPHGYEVQCEGSRARAVRWYLAKYGAVPRIPCVKVIIENEPRNGMGGWTTNAWTIHIWKGQHPFMGSLEHEFRHTLCLLNRKGDSEEAVT